MAIRSWFDPNSIMNKKKRNNPNLKIEKSPETILTWFWLDSNSILTVEVNEMSTAGHNVAIKGSRSLHNHRVWLLNVDATAGQPPHETGDRKSEREDFMRFSL